MDGSGIRNLDQIQENEPAPAGAKLASMLVASLAGACVLFAIIALARRPAAPAPPKADPLAELVTKSAASASTSSIVAGQQVAFPDLLSDTSRPTTAMATLAAGASASAIPQVSPPPATDRLPVVPLPAQNYLSLSPVVTEPRDTLTAMANQASTPTTETAPAGSSGGYQLQISSFRRDDEAQRFATALRQRGHRSHVESALVPGKGSWFRVRVGPFSSKLEALKYRREFEQREHMVPFIVDPQDKSMASMPTKHGISARIAD